MQFVDKNQDGDISLEELEAVMDKIILKISQNSHDVITFDEVKFFIPNFNESLIEVMVE